MSASEMPVLGVSGKRSGFYLPVPWWCWFCVFVFSGLFFVFLGFFN